MNGREIWLEVEQLQMDASRLTSLAYAIQDALFEGLNRAETYEGALYILCDLLGEHAKKLGGLCEAVT